jgi:hypothetical protein
MCETYGPDRIVKNANGVEIQFYVCEVIEDEEGMQAVVACSAAKKAAEAKAADKAAGDTKRNAPDRPAA